MTVEMTDEFDRIARSTVDRLIPGLLSALEGELKETLAVARSEWPIKSGRSSRGLKIVLEFRNGGELLVGGIEGDAPYTLWVRPREWFGSETAWNRLVRKQLKVVNREMAKKFQGAFITAMKEAARGH